MRDLGDLRPKETRELLALAAMAIVAKNQQQPTMVLLRLEGGEVTQEAIRAGVHELLEEKRRTHGIKHVDLSGLTERDDVPDLARYRLTLNTG